jgi:DNA polymerase III alpha subunit
MIAYQTAYLKANYPLEFASALISSVIGVMDKVSFYLRDTRERNIQILPPDVQFSQSGFSIEDNGIRFGLSAIKNVGAQVVDGIVEERTKNGPFLSFYDFILRLDLRSANKRTLESLIKGGACQSLATRAQALQILDRYVTMAQSRQQDRLSGQISLFDLEEAAENSIAHSAQNSLTYVPPLPDTPDFNQDEILKMEREYLGLYLTFHPLDQFESWFKTRTSTTIADLLESHEDQKVILGGLVTGMRRTLTKRGDMMASFQLEDLTGGIDVLVFPKVFADMVPLANEQIILLKGRYIVNDDERKIFAEKIDIVPSDPSRTESLAAATGTTTETVTETVTETTSETVTETATETVTETATETAAASGHADQIWFPVDRIETSLATKLLIHLPPSPEPNLHEQIENTLSKRPGNNHVYLKESDGSLFRTQSRLQVNVTPFLTKELHSILGSDSVEWVT